MHDPFGKLHKYEGNGALCGKTVGKLSSLWKQTDKRMANKGETNITQSNRRQKAVENHDRPYPERT